MSAYRYSLSNDGTTLSPQPRRHQKLWQFFSCIWRNAMMIMMVIGLTSGIYIGLGYRDRRGLSEEMVLVIKFPGEIFMRMLNLLLLPLIITTMVPGIFQMQVGHYERIGTRAGVYFMCTTVMASMLGIICVIILHPGRFNRYNDTTRADPKYDHLLDTYLDFLRNLIPENLIQACFQHTITDYKAASDNSTKRQRSVVYKDGMNIIGVICVSVVLGLIIVSMREDAAFVKKIFYTFSAVLFRVVNMVMWFSPFGTMSLVAIKIMSLTNAELADVVMDMCMYVTTVLIGLTVHTFGVLTLFFYTVTHRNPLAFLRGMIPALLTAFMTSSSRLTLPITIHCAQEKMHIDKRVARFLFTIGSVINMDGTALFEAVAAIFIAQSHDIVLTSSQVVLVCVVSTLASLCASSVYCSGLVNLLIVLTAVDLPTDDMIVIIAVHWIMDRLLTVVNIISDAYGAGIVDHLSRHELEEIDKRVRHLNVLRRYRMAVSRPYTVKKEGERSTLGSEVPNNSLTASPVRVQLDLLA